MSSGIERDLVREIDELLALHPSSPELWMLRGQVFERGGTTESVGEARRSYERAQALAPDDERVTGALDRLRAM